MQKKNLGKEFEKRIKACLDEVPTPDSQFNLDRLPDPVGGYVGVRNICDFTGYKFPFAYFIECKCTYGNTLNFKSAITADQWEGLTEKSAIFGCLGGVCVWFIDYDVTAFVPIQELNRLRYDLNKKSLSINDIDKDKLNYIELLGKKNKIYFKYDHIFLVNALNDMNKSYWHIKDIKVIKEDDLNE